MKIFAKSIWLLASALVASSAHAQIAQDTFENVRLGTDTFDFYNNPLLEGDAQVYTLLSGETLFFGTSVFGSTPDVLNATFTGSPGLTVSPGTQSYAYLFGGGNNFTQLLTFTGAPGTYTGNIFLDFAVSTADYNRNGTFQNGANFAYTVNLLSPTGAVPEPSTWAMMLLGFGAVGFSLRRKHGALLQAD